jgi:uncharacterized protein YcnI
MNGLIRHASPRQRVFIGLVAALLLVMLMPRVAYAHVTVLPVTVPVATTQVFTIRVPTERDVPTTSVRIEFPPELLVARFAPMPEWTREVEQDGAGRIVAATWSGGAIGADEYQDFVFLGRTPREPGVLTFNAYQTYEGGETVAWVEPPDQNHPAPTVEVVAVESPLAATETHMDVATASAPDAVTSSTTTVGQTGATNTPTSEGMVGMGTMETVMPVADAEGSAEHVVSTSATSTGGTDLPLIVALVALVVALVAVALAAVAVARRPAAP